MPWAEEYFNYKIPGRVEPGERATWKLSPNMFGPWGRVPKHRADMVLTVTMMGLDGPDGQAPFDATVFGNDDEKWLDELRRRQASRR